MLCSLEYLLQKYDRQQCTFLLSEPQAATTRQFPHRNGQELQSKVAWNADVEAGSELCRLLFLVIGCQGASPRCENRKTCAFEHCCCDTRCSTMGMGIPQVKVSQALRLHCCTTLCTYVKSKKHRRFSEVPSREPEACAASGTCAQQLLILSHFAKNMSKRAPEERLHQG